jgi:hypothetical protein
MSQALKALTPNRHNFKSAHRPQTATLVLPAGLAAALEELCMLTAYHPDGFTYTPQMEAACQHIADKSSPAAIAACRARASHRERTYVTASRAA